MVAFEDPDGLLDHCRIGSLEIEQCRAAMCAYDHCRIGSLER